jgi:(R,R)-butanediol dehydrogenase / meso-butanediol dehydrogenase / diacetyl reductase
MSDVTAALITARATVTFRRFTQAPPPPGCVTIDISLCGICGTDIHSFRSGHLHSPAVCGHEWVGTVAAAGTGVDGLQEGDRAVLAVPPACGRCPECQRGLGEYCRTASLVARGRDPLAPPHGGFAGTITVQATRVMRAHPDLTDEVAAQVEPATVAFHGVRRSGIMAGDTVVIQGAGPIGLLALQFARAAGAGDVLVVEPSPTRRRLATELGAINAVAPDEAAEYVQDHTHGIGADVVIECAGVPRLLQTAVDLARSGGVVQLLSFLSEPATVNAARWLAKQVTVVASNAFTHDDFRRSMSFLADGRVRAQPLHSRTVRLDELEATLRGLSAGPSDDIKVLVDPRRPATVEAV